jgi:hypothetical protein
MAVRTPADHYRRRMVAGGGQGSLFSERSQPVLAAPPGGVGRVDGDHTQALVMGHLREPVPEPGSRYSGYEPTEGPAALAARRAAAVHFPTLGTRASEVQILDGHCTAVVVLCHLDQGADRITQQPVAVRSRQVGNRKRDADRGADWIAVRQYDPGGKMVIVHVYGQHLVRLAVSGDEPSFGFPAGPPPGSREFGRVKVPTLRQVLAAPADAHVPLCHLAVHGGGPRSHLLQALLLPPPLRLSRISSRPAALLADRDREPDLDLPGPCL